MTSGIAIAIALLLFVNTILGIILLSASLICDIYFIFKIIIYLKSPDQAILYNDRDTIYIKNIAIPLTEIKDVSYEKEYIIFSKYTKKSTYGTIKIFTTECKYKIYYIADCERASIRLRKLAQRHGKHNLQ